MDAKLIVNGCEINVGVELLGNFAGNLSDDESFQDLFHVLAQSKSANIRQEIAYKDKISEETALLLLNDSDSAVLDRIVRNDVAKIIIDEATLDKIIKVANEETLKTIANAFENYENIKPELTADKLIAIGNPSVTLAVAENGSTPKKVLKALLKDSDPDIARAAKNSLD